MNELEIKNELQELKNLTLLGAKQALTMNDAALLTGLSKSHLYKLVCAKKVPYYKSQGGKLTYFDKTELTAWQLQHRIKTSDELEDMLDDNGIRLRAASKMFPESIHAVTKEGFIINVSSV